MGNGFTPKSTSIYLNGFTPNLTQFDRALITQFDWSNLTGRIGCKSIEIMTTKFDQAGRHAM